MSFIFISAPSQVPETPSNQSRPKISNRPNHNQDMKSLLTLDTQHLRQTDFWATDGADIISPSDHLCETSTTHTPSRIFLPTRMAIFYVPLFTEMTREIVDKA